MREGREGSHLLKKAESVLKVSPDTSAAPASPFPTTGTADFRARLGAAVVAFAFFVPFTARFAFLATGRTSSSESSSSLDSS